jgi:hypothetical protein
MGLDSLPLGTKHGLGGAPDEFVGRHHLGHDQGRPEAAGDAAEDGIRDP